MVPEQNLASEISDYLTQAKGLETTRRALVDRILGVVKTQIIPEISPLLPHGYSIDTERTSVRGVDGDSLPYAGVRDIAHGTVPTGFDVRLKLLYDGKPTGYHNDKPNVIEAIKQIRQKLKPKLEELAKSHNLDSIMPFGESPLW